MIYVYLILGVYVKFMVSVKRFIGSRGERFAVLIDSDGIPLTYPNLYTTINFRNRGHSVNTIVAVLEDIELLYYLLSKLQINIEQRIKEKVFLQLYEIESLANLANFKRNYLFNKKTDRKIVSFPEKRREAVRAKIVIKHDNVSKNLIYRRLTNFADYLHWLETYLGKASATNTSKTLKAHRPRKTIDQSASYKSFEQDQIKLILETIDPSNQKNIWTTDFLNYRNELIIYLLLYLGCRKGELLNIKLSDFVQSNGSFYINIKRNHNDGNDTRLYQPLVKTRSRGLALNLNLKKKIDQYILTYRSQIVNAESSDFLLISNQGTPLSINALDKIFTQISSRFQFRVHAHAFRHTWNDQFTDKVQTMIESGRLTEDKAENDRAYLMGWIPGSQSARRYAKRAEDRRAVEVGLGIQNKFEENNE